MSDDEDSGRRAANQLPVWGNEKTMNLNQMILTNIQSSPYFKVDLYKLKTYHQVIDEIYYHVAHLEPWEKGSRKVQGQVGMCGGVRGVGAGGIVSSAYCCLYKLYTLKLTKKQIYGLLDHADSPYIRGLGFMYLRYTQPPPDLLQWFEPYFEDDEEVDPKAGGGDPMTMGQLCRNMLQQLDWYCTLFPRIPVPVQKQINARIENKFPPQKQAPPPVRPDHPPRARELQDAPKPMAPSWERQREKDRVERRRRSRSGERREKRRDGSRERKRSKERRHKHKSHRDRSREKQRDRHTRDRSLDKRRY